MKRIRIADFINSEDDFFTLPFGSDADGLNDARTGANPNGHCGSDSEEKNPNEYQGEVRWGLTLRKAGSMRFRWNETNPCRQKNFSKLLSDSNHIVVPVQLDHTKIVYDIKSPEDTKGKIGDGLITKNPLFVPTITIADCMPIFLFDPVTKVFGIVHSGWKGTGIVSEAIKLAEQNYGAKPQDFQVVLGPHIHDCCYIVDKTRADYFASEFTPECVEPLDLENTSGSDAKKLPSFVWNNGNGPLFRLSLEKANLAVLEKCGVRNDNITICEDCTACAPGEIFGSNRRETATKGKDNFTIMAGFVINEG